MRSSVVLPHPDGPSSVKNSPSRTAIATLSTARTVPKLRATPSIVIAVKRTSWVSPRTPDDVLYLLRGLAALLDPGILGVVHELHLFECRHPSGPLGEVELL